MMLIIADKSPYKAVDWLIENTNKQFVWKQLLELGQLICFCGISEVFKPLKQGKELQNWIVTHLTWVSSYFSYLYNKCLFDINLKDETKKKISKINMDLYNCLDLKIPVFTPIFVDTAIWRYSKDYESKYPTNSELPIDICVEEYKKYLEWKINDKI